MRGKWKGTNMNNFICSVCGALSDHSYYECPNCNSYMNEIPDNCCACRLCGDKIDDKGRILNGEKFCAATSNCNCTNEYMDFRDNKPIFCPFVKFKKGDKIRAIQDYENSRRDIKKGMTGTVIDMSPGSPPIRVKWDNDLENWVSEDFLNVFIYDNMIELIERPRSEFVNPDKEKLKQIISNLQRQLKIATDKLNEIT